MIGIELSGKIADVVVITPDVHGDERGRFVETYRRSWFPLGREMIQANRSDKAARRGRRTPLPLAPGRLLVRTARKSARDPARSASRLTYRRRHPFDGPRRARGQGNIHTAGCRTWVRYSDRCLVVVPRRRLLQRRRRIGCGMGRSPRSPPTGLSRILSCRRVTVSTRGVARSRRRSDLATGFAPDAFRRSSTSTSFRAHGRPVTNASS